jgi:3-deoxy-D-manno-octulosonate 8-phosphate phosphatase (KDO 8-P phosphatase)
MISSSAVSCEENRNLGRESTRLLSAAHWARLRAVKSLTFDVDGVLTDDSVFIGPGSTEFKRFHVSDGLAIALMRKRLKIKVAVVSGRHSEATTARAEELGIAPCLQGAQNKRQAVDKVIKAHRVRREETVFVGNELLDLAAFKAVGFRIAVADAVPELLQRADLVLQRRGGQGVARELFELLCRARGVDYVRWFE